MHKHWNSTSIIMFIARLWHNISSWKIIIVIALRYRQHTIIQKLLPIDDNQIYSSIVPRFKCFWDFPIYSLMLTVLSSFQYISNSHSTWLFFSPFFIYLFFWLLLFFTEAKAQQCDILTLIIILKLCERLIRMVLRRSDCWRPLLSLAAIAQFCSCCNGLCNAHWRTAQCFRQK